MKRHYGNLSDKELLTSITVSNDRKAFEALYLRYSIRVFDLVHARVNDRYNAQEIVQELFVGLWQKRRSLSIQNCRAYLFSAAKNLVISHYRREIAREARQQNWAAGRRQVEELTYEETIAQDLHIRYQEGLKLLPDKCQRVFTLSREGLTNHEVAEQLDISEKTVEQHITKALRFLKVYLREHLAYLAVLASAL